jgi:hypothetical protein
VAEEKLRDKIVAADLAGLVEPEKRPDDKGEAGGRTFSLPGSHPPPAIASPYAPPGAYPSTTSTTPLYPPCPSYPCPSYPCPSWDPYQRPAGFVPPSPPGVAQFNYVARLPAERRKAAAADAYAKAKAQAEELADAAGAKLGPLVSLNSSVSSTSAEVRPGYIAGCAVMAPIVGDGSASRDNEAMFTEPREIEFHIQVTAQFGLR